MKNGAGDDDFLYKAAISRQSKAQLMMTV